MKKKDVDYRSLYMSLIDGRKKSTKIPKEIELQTLTRMSGIYSKTLRNDSSTLLDLIQKIAQQCDFPLFISNSTDPKIMFQRVQDLLNYFFSQIERSVSPNLQISNSMHYPNFKPQLKFKGYIIDNSNDSLFIPKLTKKPNSTHEIDLKLSIHDFSNYSAINTNEISHSFQNRFVNGVYIGSNPKPNSFLHPYAPELFGLKFQNNSAFLKLKQPFISSFNIDINSLNESNFLIIKNSKQLLNLCGHIKKNFSEIGVAVKNHYYRSYHGFLCIILISTPKKIFFVDIIDFVDSLSDLEMLNTIFTNKNIVKVVYDATDSLILSLQRDFGVYFVNIFNLSIAANELQFPSSQLHFLIKNYCNVLIDIKHDSNIIHEKIFNGSDWRIRPLGNEMLKSSIEKVHFLLYLYDKMKYDMYNMNGSNEMIKRTFEKSCTYALKRYEKKNFEKLSFYKMCENLKKLYKMSFDEKRDELLGELMIWRNEIARENDESEIFVCDDVALLQICKNLPDTENEFYECFEHREEKFGPKNKLPIFAEKEKEKIMGYIQNLQKITEIEQIGIVNSQSFDEDLIRRDSEKDVAKLNNIFLNGQTLPLTFSNNNSPSSFEKMFLSPSPPSSFDSTMDEIKRSINVDQFYKENSLFKFDNDEEMSDNKGEINVLVKNPSITIRLQDDFSERNKDKDVEMDESSNNNVNNSNKNNVTSLYERYNK